MDRKCGVVVCVIFSGESATFGHVFHVLRLGGTVILVKKPLFLLCILDVPMVCCFLSLNVIFVGKSVFFLQKRFTFDHFFDQNGIRKTSGVPLTTSGVTMGRLDDVSVAPEAPFGPESAPWIKKPVCITRGYVPKTRILGHRIAPTPRAVKLRNLETLSHCHIVTLFHSFIVTLSHCFIVS